MNDGQMCTSISEATALYDLKLAYAKMPTWLMTWVRDRNPTSGEESMRLADQHLHYHEQPRYPQKGQNDQFKENGS